MLQPATMPPADRTQPATGVACRNCGQPLPEGKSVCSACGAAHGESNRCPHCDAVADVEPHAALGFRCLVCGGPRVALDASEVVLGAGTRGALAKAGTEQTKQLMLSGAGVVLCGMGALALLIATMVVAAAEPGQVASAAAYLAAVTPLLTGLLALSRAAVARKQRTRALHEAEVAALGDAQAALGPLSAARAAELMRIAPERAELLLAEASVATLLAEAPAPKLRVDAAVPGVPSGQTQLSEPAPETTTDAAAGPARTTRRDTET